MVPWTWADECDWRKQITVLTGFTLSYGRKYKHVPLALSSHFSLPVSLPRSLFNFFPFLTVSHIYMAPPSVLLPLAYLRILLPELSFFSSVSSFLSCWVIFISMWTYCTISVFSLTHTSTFLSHLQQKMSKRIAHTHFLYFLTLFYSTSHQHSTKLIDQSLLFKKPQ